MRHVTWHAFGRHKANKANKANSCAFVSFSPPLTSSHLTELALAGSLAPLGSCRFQAGPGGRPWRARCVRETFGDGHVDPGLESLRGSLEGVLATITLPGTHMEVDTPPCL